MSYGPRLVFRVLFYIWQRFIELILEMLKREKVYRICDGDYAGF